VNTSTMMTFADAKALLSQRISPITDTQQQPLADAIGFTLAAAFKAPIALPPADNSAMDGFALASGSNATVGEQYKVVGTAFAGAPWSGQVAPGEAVRIMTGGWVPAGADRVVIQEDVRQLAADVIELTAACPQGDNIRPRGDDVQQGQTLLAAGHRLQVADCCLLQALGVETVEVIRPVRVALMATGDELKSPGETLGPGAIYESNRLALRQMLAPHPVDITDLGIIPDQPEQLRQVLSTAAEHHDLVISTGGVSVGAADYTRAILTELGNVEFWKVAIKPGKPVAFGRLNQALFFGLPGNPVSAVVTAHQLLLPALAQLAGQPYLEPIHLSARLTAPLSKRPGRMEWQRARLHATQNTQGVWEHHATPITGQGSHMIGSLSQANAYIIIAAEQGNLATGEWVHVVPFDAALRR